VLFKKLGVAGRLLGSALRRLPEAHMGPRFFSPGIVSIGWESVAL
jgi:hypothetical protein